MYDCDAYYEDMHVLPEHDDPENNGETQGPEFGDGDDWKDDVDAREERGHNLGGDDW